MKDLPIERSSNILKLTFTSLQQYNKANGYLQLVPRFILINGKFYMNDNLMHAQVSDFILKRKALVSFK